MKNSRPNTALFPPRVPLAEAQKKQAVVKLSTERKHLTNVLKMVAYHIESELLELIRPHYKRVEEEGRTFIQAALQDAADIEPTKISSVSRWLPLSSPHRSRVLKLFARPSTKPTHRFLALNSKCITRWQPPLAKKRTGFRCTMSGALKLRVINVVISSTPVASTNNSFIINCLLTHFNFVQ